MASPNRPARMTGQQRREQLLSVGRALFAEKGFEGTSVEEIAARAKVSKPVVYEHFGGKEGMYAVIVDREVQRLTSALTEALGQRGHPRTIVERSATTLLDYVENERDGFRILVRDSPVAQATGTFSSLLGDVAVEVEHLLADKFRETGLNPQFAPLYAQMLVGMIALTGQWWLESRWPKKSEVSAHLVNLAWNGLRSMERSPSIPQESSRKPVKGSRAEGAEGKDEPESRSDEKALKLEAKAERAAAKAERAAARAAAKSKETTPTGRE